MIKDNCLTTEQKIKFIEQTDNYGDMRQAWFPPSAADEYYFVSYCHKDYKKVFRDIFELQNSATSLAVWYDRELRAGRSWQVDVKSHIYDYNCKGVIFYISENSVLSDAIAKEMRIVKQSGKMFLPIVLPIETVEELKGRFLPGSELLKVMQPELSPTDEKRLLYDEMFSKDITFYKLTDDAEYKAQKIKQDIIGKPLVEVVGEAPRGISVDPDLITVITVKAVNDINVVSIRKSDFPLKKQRDAINAIGNCAFANCRLLEEIELPESLMFIFKNAFFGCSNLKHIVLPPKVEYIDENSFNGCESLVSCNIPDGVYYIGDGAFSGCSSLEMLNIPASVLEIGKDAFVNCKRLRLTVDEKNEHYVMRDGILYKRDFSEIVFIPDNISGEINIPDGVTEIRSGYFSGRGEITRINIPDSVTSISSSAFTNCDKLKEIIIPPQVTRIEEMTFAFCNELETVILPQGLEHIDSRAFYCCRKLAKVVVPDTVQTIGISAFAGCFALSDFKMSDGIRYIDMTAFEACYALESVEIPDSIKTVRNETFQRCAGLKRVVISGRMGVAPYGMFYDCQSLAEVVIGYGMEAIGMGAFMNCKSLKCVTLPKTLQRIQDNAFSGCESLTDIYYGGTQAEWGNVWIGYHWKSSTNVTIHCADGDITVHEWGKTGSDGD